MDNKEELKLYCSADNLDVIEDKALIVMAKVSFISTVDGGRKTPIYGSSSYRPNHNFGNEENRHFHIGVIDFDKQDVIHPGEERQTKIHFMYVRGLKELLYIGRIWRIQEGPDLVATAEIVEIISS